MSSEPSYESLLKEIQSLRGEVERLLHVANVHSEMLLLTHALVYEANILEDAFTYVSPHAEKLTGFTQEQWLRPGGFSALLERCHPDDANRIKAKIDQFMKDPTSAPPDNHWTYRWQDNFDRWHWCRKTFRLFLESYSNQPRIMAYIQDVTELLESSHFRRRWLGLSDVDASGARLDPTLGDPDLLKTLLDTGGLGLTSIQRQVLELVLVGMSNKQIALRLHRSIRTIEDHRSRIMRKLGAANSVELVRKILEQHTVQK